MIYEVYIITPITINFNKLRDIDLMKNAANNTAITPGIIILMEAFLLYAPFLINFIEAGGIKNAQEPIIIGNATNGDIPKA